MKWTFLILLGLSILGGAGGIFLIRVRRLKRDLAALQFFSRRLLEAQEKERKQIAAALHDSLCQDLLIIKSRAELALASETDASAVARQLKEISKTSELIIDRTRQIAHGLGPPHLEQLGLTETLDAMIDRVAAATGIRFERKLELVDDVFSLESATSFYRIAQESCNNIMKHARPSLVRLELIRDLHHVQLVIRDDGDGFDVAALRARRRNCAFGLAEITERVRLLGGRFEIESQPGLGTQLTVTIPFKDGQKV